MTGLRRWLTLASVAVLALALTHPSARADSTQISIMQDDQLLVDSNTSTVTGTLARLQQLGVETVRVNLEWATVAPGAKSRRVPLGFAPGAPEAKNPASYPAAAWAPYDRVAELAPLYGITVQFNLTSPGPLWAMGRGAPSQRLAPHWKPNARDFGAFVAAVGARYSGHYEGLPAVGQWSVWNEPNQPGWLAPQWSKQGRRTVRSSPRIYRSLVDAAYAALAATGHSVHDNTILIGETAPEGADRGGVDTPMTPIPFLDAFYCVSAAQKRLAPAAARAIGCPTRGGGFTQANPGLFDATGFAHHPYDFFRTPSYRWMDPNFVPLSQLSRLESLLDRSFRTYGVHRKIPLYLTEYGYETKPPDPHQVVSLAQQAAYLNQADYLAYEDPRVVSVAQFLLRDSAPNPLYRPGQYDFWDTFQTGLEFLHGSPKPSFTAYRMPLWLPLTQATAGTRLKVWGQVRPADRRAAQPVSIQWRPAHSRGPRAWRTLTTAHTLAETGYFNARIRLPGTGSVRSLWRGTVGGEAQRDAVAGTYSSRTVAVSVSLTP